MTNHPVKANGILYILLFSILFIALILRMYKITTIPPGFFADEAALGYNAYKILTTGKDEHGKFLPIFFESFGEYRVPIPIYSNIPFILLFGLNEFSVRFTTALFGVGTVLLFFLIGKAISGSRLGLFAAFLLAISPWHLHLSRWGAEYASFLFYYSLAFWLFLIALKSHRLLPLVFFIYGLGLYTYYPAWLLVPVTVAFSILFWIVQKGIKHFRYLLLGLLVFFIICLPLAQGIKEGYVLTRWNVVQKKGLSWSQQQQKFWLLYVDHLRPAFLFQTGDIGYPGHFISRQFVRGMGMFYIYQIPLILLGMFFALAKIHRGGFFVFLAVLLYPLAGSLTFDGPSSTRSLLGIWPFILLSAFGIILILRFISFFPRLIRIIIFSYLTIWLVTFMVTELHNYLHNYYVDYPNYSADYWGWQAGPKAVVNYMMSVQDSFDELIMSGGEANGPTVFIPFYSLDNKYGCRKCRVGDINSLDLTKRQLFVASYGTIKFWQSLKGYPPFDVIKEFYYPNGAVSYVAITYNDMFATLPKSNLQINYRKAVEYLNIQHGKYVVYYTPGLGSHLLRENGLQGKLTEDFSAP